ncbi:MAG: HAMP domain-containing sensor histidine kinase [Coriobacteriales bacterium]|nr:HAMP domain-containing sensor histidine kinase [Coriobacteriales bacterium]
MSDAVMLRLRRKIVAASIVAVFASLAALIFAINYAHYLQTDASLRTAMEEIAHNLEANKEDRREDKSQLREDSGGQASAQGDEATWAVRGGRKSAHTQYASRFLCVLVAQDGSMFVRAKGNEGLTNDDALDLAQRALDSGKEEGILDDYKYLVEPLDDQTRILFLDCTTELESLHQLLIISLVVGGCALVVASLFVLRFSGLAVRPLEESARKQKQFVADASHELKTPLSVIATNMDILEVDLADQPEEQEWIDSTNRQVDSMKHLVNDLLMLSKMEEQEADLVIADVSLTDVAHETVLTYAQLARSQDKELVCAIEEDVCVRGDEPAIRQLMSILVDNAIKYATGDGTIRVGVRREARKAVFFTQNDWNHDVDARELPTLFDRFVRGERSRDRSDGRSGYGLGLSIARAIAEKNDARLEAIEDESGRIVFRAIFSR